MRVLLDQGVGRTAAEELRAAGHEASHVAEHGLSSAFDEEILAFALGLGLYTLPALVCALLLWLVADAAHRGRLGWSRPLVGAVVAAHLLGAVVLIDMALAAA